MSLIPLYSLLYIYIHSYIYTILCMYHIPFYRKREKEGGAEFSGKSNTYYAKLPIFPAWGVLFLYFRREGGGEGHTHKD